MKNTNFTYNMTLTQMFYFSEEHQEFRLFTLKDGEKILVAKIPASQFGVMFPSHIIMSNNNRSMIIEDQSLDLLIKIEMPMPFDIKRGRVVEIIDISAYLTNNYSKGTNFKSLLQDVMKASDGRHSCMLQSI